MTRFRGLPKRQSEVFEQIAIGNDGGHHPKVLQALLDKGLIERGEQQLGGWPPMTVYRYWVPIPIHMEWCEWCSEIEE